MEGLFGNKITNSKVFLKLQFYKLKMEDNDDVRDHLEKMQSLVQQLSSLKCPPDDDDKMAVLMKSMEGISHFENTLEILRLASTTFHHMVALILEKDRRNKDSTLSSGLEEAFISTNKWKANKNIICRYCKRKGHIDANCFKKKSRTRRTSRLIVLERFEFAFSFRE